MLANTRLLLWYLWIKSSIHVNFKMHVILNMCVHMHECACATCLEINFIPIKKNVSLDDPSIIYSEKHDTEPSFKKPHIIHLYKYLNMLVLIQAPKPVFQKHFPWFLHQCLLKLLRNKNQYPVWESQAFHLCTLSSPQKKHYFLFAYLKYIFTLPPTAVFVTKTPLFCIGQKKAFCLQLQDNKKNNKKRGEKEAIMGIWRVCTCSIFTQSPNYFFLTYCLLIFPLSLGDHPLSSFCCLQPQKYQNKCYKIMLFLYLYFSFAWFK